MSTTTDQTTDQTADRDLATADGVRRYRRRTTQLQVVMVLAATAVIALALLFPQT